MGIRVREVMLMGGVLFARSPYYEKRKGKKSTKKIWLTFFITVESLLTESGFATHSFNVRLLKTYSQGNFKMPASYNGSAPPRATFVFCQDQWLVGFKGLPIMKNVREKFCQRILPYVFKYCGVSMIITLRASNTDSRVGLKRPAS